MTRKAVEVLASGLVLGLVRTEELPGAAARVLEQGRDSPSLRMLAGLTAVELSGARALFDRVLAELHVGWPTTREAVVRLARQTAEDILHGRMGASPGAERISDLAHRAWGERFPELDPFIYAVSEWEDRQEDRGLLEEMIVAAARDLLPT